MNERKILILISSHWKKQQGMPRLVLIPLSMMKWCRYVNFSLQVWTGMYFINVTQWNEYFKSIICIATSIHHLIVWQLPVDMKFWVMTSILEGSKVVTFSYQLKESSPIFSFFFSNFWRSCYHKKAHIFLITLGKIYSYTVFHVEYIDENVSGYGIKR